TSQRLGATTVREMTTVRFTTPRDHTLSTWGSTLAQLPGTGGGRRHRFQEGGPHRPGLEGGEAGGGGAAGGRHGRPQRLRPVGALGQQGGRAEQRLDDQGLADRPG